MYHCIAVLHFPSRVFSPLLPFADYLAIRAFCFVGNSLHYVFALCSGDFVHIGIGEHGTALSQQGADSGLFLSIPQLWQLLRQAEKLAQIPLCASVHRDIQKTLQALHPLRKKLSTFRFSIRLESDIAIFAYFFTEIVNVFFLREVIPVSKAFFLLQGRQEQIEEVFRYFGLVDVLCSVSELRDGLPYYVYRKLAARVKRFMQKGFIIRL